MSVSFGLRRFKSIKDASTVNFMREITQTKTVIRIINMSGKINRKH